MNGLEIFFKTLEKEKVEYLFSPPNSFGPQAENLFKKKFSKSKYLERIISGTEQGLSLIHI